jgi:hypothetical protein
MRSIWGCGAAHRTAGPPTPQERLRRRSRPAPPALDPWVPDRPGQEERAGPDGPALGGARPLISRTRSLCGQALATRMQRPRHPRRVPSLRGGVTRVVNLPAPPLRPRPDLRRHRLWSHSLVMTKRERTMGRGRSGGVGTSGRCGATERSRCRDQRWAVGALTAGGSACAGPESGQERSRSGLEATRPRLPQGRADCR